jgi:membrane protease YdiL (CAAX protease family)
MPVEEAALLSNQLPPKPRRGIAPLWHTLVLIATIVGISALGAGKLDPSHGDPTRLAHYAVSAAMELLLVLWVFFGVRIRKIPFRTLLGSFPRDINSITREAGIALLFWLISMCVLASVAVTWNLVQTAIHHREQQHESSSQKSSEPSPEKQQIEMARKLMRLAPANGIEIAAWGALCLIVGFSEELVFRGYLQQQGISLLHSAAAGAVFSATIFGAAHGYQGARGMFLIGIYGALFSVVALIRRNLFPGMLAHSWHDFATGLALALIRETHMLDRLPIPN